MPPRNARMYTRALIPHKAIRVATAQNDPLDGPSKVLTGTSVLMVASVALLVFLDGPDSWLPQWRAMGGWLLIGSIISYYCALGILAARLGDRWFVWVLPAALTFPVGWVVAYFLIRRRISATRAP